MQEIDVLITLIQERRYSDAEELARNLTNRDGDNAFGWKVLAVALACQGRTLESLDPMQRAIRLLPGDAEAHLNLGKAFRDLGRPEQAEEAYRTAIGIKPEYVEAHYNLGAVLKVLGRPEQAAEAYRAAVRYRPDYAEAYSNLGNLLRDLGRQGEAEQAFRTAIRIKPDFASAHYNLGNVLTDRGLPEQAQEAYRAAIRCQPEYARAYLNLGNTLAGLLRPEQAEEAYRAAIRIEPDFAEAHSNLGNTLHGLGRTEEAEEAYRSAIRIAPEYARAHYNLGIALRELGRPGEAEEAYRSAIRVMPEYAEAHFNLGNALKDLGRPGEAEEAYRSAIRIKPDFAEAHLNLGLALKALGRQKQAEEAYRSAIRIKPEFAEAYLNLGNALMGLERPEQAEAAYRTALRIKPEYAEAYCNLGVALQELGRLEEAEKAYRTDIRIKPEHAEAYTNLGTALKELGRLEQAEKAHRSAMRIKPDYFDAYSNLLFAMGYNGCHSPLVLLEEARKYGQMATDKATAAFSAWLCPEGARRLRVGLVSGDFRNHPVGYFLENALSRLDTERIELFAYPTQHKTDELTSRLKPRFSAWKSLVGLSDEKAARLIHADGVQVLIDLSGHTAHNRLPVFAWKPAPVQATWLGYWAGTGVAEMDYLLADPTGVPPGQESQFSETVWHLPDTRMCFSPIEGAPPVSGLPALGTTGAGITFGCFQILPKVNDRTLSLWARVLTLLPFARLRWQCKQFDDARVRSDTLERLSRSGISPGRVCLLGKVPRGEYLAAYSEVDIVLDTAPFTGGTTTCEALWMGVPTLTLSGETMLARQGASLLTAAGLSGWIAESEDDFVAKGVRFAGNGEAISRLAELRSTLRAKVAASPLFDAERFGRNLESALWGMWERRLAGQGQDAPSGAECPGESPQSLDLGEDAFNGLITLFQAGRYAEAEDLARRTTARSPEDGYAWKMLAAALAGQGRNLESLEPMQRAIRLLPDDAEAHSNLGVTLTNLGQLEQAEQAFQAAIAIRPEHALAHFNLGIALKGLGRTEQAVQAYETAIALQPEYARAHYNLGNALRELDRLEQAEQAFKAAIRIKPEYAQAHSNLGVTLQDLGRLEEAEQSQRRAIGIQPDYLSAHSNLLLSMCYNAGHGPLEQREEADRYGRTVTGQAKETFSSWRCPDRPERLRVGLVSGDLRGHPVGHFLESTLSRLNAESIELMAYPTQQKTDELTSRIKPHFSAWQSIFGLSDEKAARLIHADGVQVLIDLSGHTAHNRLPVFAWKPAPVQATWLGYLGTTGVAEIDYLLGDPQATPPENDAHFSESVWRLPEVWGCFTPPDTAPAVAPLPALSAGCITFGCFNNLSKMTDQVVALWARVLKAVPGSRLFLKTKQLTNSEVGEHTRQRFAAQGIAPDRLILEGASPRNLLLAAYNRVDIALDPFPYGGGTTTYETLWMAVPIITLKGDQFLSRCGLSLATAAGLPDWVADGEDDYVTKAVLHSQDLKRLAALREGLREQVRTSPLFDAERFSRNLERALWEMWERWRCAQGRDTASVINDSRTNGIQ